MRISSQVLFKGAVLIMFIVTGKYALAQTEGTTDERGVHAICEVHDDDGNRIVYGFFNGKWQVIPFYPEDVELPNCGEAYPDQKIGKK